MKRSPQPPKRALRIIAVGIGMGIHLLGACQPAGDVRPSAGADSVDSVDRYIQALMVERQIPGLSLVVVQEGRVVKEEHYGLANLELNAPVDANTAFAIGSMTKALTPIGLLLLVEDGKVGLDDSITKYFDDLPAEWQDITPRRLLNHTSGIPDDWTRNRGDAHDFFLIHSTDASFLRALVEVPLLFSPGEAYGYSGGAFVVGMLIERISGMPYAQFMRERVFEPLGMTRTRINDGSGGAPERASGYRVVDGNWTGGIAISPAAAARADVGVISTARDLARWDAAMSDTRLLSRNSLDALVAPGVLKDGTISWTGLGWDLYSTRGYRTLDRRGALRTGYSSELVRYGSHELTVIVLTNLWNAFDDDPNLSRDIASFFDPEFRRISSMTPRADPDADRSRLLRSVLEPISRGSHDLGRLTAGFPISGYDTASWRERHDGLTSFSFIDCQDRSGRGESTAGEAVREVCFYSFADGEGSGYLVYSLAEDGRVADLYSEELVAHSEANGVSLRWGTCDRATHSPRFGGSA